MKYVAILPSRGSVFTQYCKVVLPEYPQFPQFAALQAEKHRNCILIDQVGNWIPTITRQVFYQMEEKQVAVGQLEQLIFNNLVKVANSLLTKQPV